MTTQTQVRKLNPLISFNSWFYATFSIIFLDCYEFLFGKRARYLPWNYLGLFYLARIIFNPAWWRKQKDLVTITKVFIIFDIYAYVTLTAKSVESIFRALMGRIFHFNSENRILSIRSDANFVELTFGWRERDLFTM